MIRRRDLAITVLTMVQAGVHGPSTRVEGAELVGVGPGRHAVDPGGSVMAQPRHETRGSTNLEIVRSRFEAWSKGTGSPFDLLTDAAVWTIVGRSAAAGTYEGRAAFMREVIQPFNARMQRPLTPRVRRMYADGDTVVVLFDATGLARDGQPYRNTYAWFLEMQGGRVITATAFFDSIAFDELWTRVRPE